MASQFLAILAAGGLLSAGVVASETRSAAVLPLAGAMLAQGAGGAGEKCRVDVVRAGVPGSAAITRATLPQGGCVCTITTGPSGSANGAAEDVVSALLRDRECENAPAPGDIGEAARGAAGGGGGSGVLIGVLVAAGVAGGLAAGLGGDSQG